VDTTAPGPDTPARLSFVGGADSSTRLARLGLAGLLATSLLVCLSATRSELLLPSSLRPLPASLAGPLAGAGLKLCVFALIFIAIVAWLLRKVWLGEMDWIAGAGRATAALLVSTGFLVPWYVAWLLPPAALSSDKRLLAAAVILTGVGLTTL
jgi:hypothetical protein